jgi:hypothetical protein
VTQQIIACALDDLHDKGSVAFNFAGANNPKVAAAKAEWGGDLAS